MDNLKIYKFIELMREIVKDNCKGASFVLEYIYELNLPCITKINIGLDEDKISDSVQEISRNIEDKIRKEMGSICRLKISSGDDQLIYDNGKSDIEPIKMDNIGMFADWEQERVKGAEARYLVQSDGFILCNLIKFPNGDNWRYYITRISSIGNIRTINPN